MSRKAVCAGTWYPDNPTQIAEYLKPQETVHKAKGIIVPHAGWIYSGKVAGEVFSAVEPADTYVLLGPNHTGMGNPVSLYAEGAWE